MHMGAADQWLIYGTANYAIVWRDKFSLNKFFFIYSKHNIFFHFILQIQNVFLEKNYLILQFKTYNT